ncbi:Exosome complex component MTR3 [Aphanomyces cochlioides]|nr:Exosome complex component MTR3 [Aphanomyces cochlioides]
MQNCYFPQPVQVRPTETPTVKSPRRDGRGGDEYRACFMRCGVLSHAAGSAYVEFGQTRVVVAVYGPRAEVNPRLTKGQPVACEIKLPTALATYESEYGNLMRQALEPAILVSKFPKCQVSIHAVVLESDGSELSAAITCASLALVDAGIEMIDMVAACSAGVWQDEIVLDPTADEQASTHVLVAFMPAQGQITHLMQQGKLSYARVQEAITLCTDGCAGVLNTMMRTCVVQSLNQR